MRRRQICNMHGGYRGSGVTIDWHTTPSQNVPIDKPIINPIKPEPEPLPIQPDKKGSNIIGIVGLTLSGIGLASLAGIGAYTAYKNNNQPMENGIIEEGQRVPLLRGKKQYVSLSEAEQERWREDDPEPELQLAPDPRQALKDVRQERDDLGFLRSLGPSYFEEIE